MHEIHSSELPFGGAVTNQQDGVDPSVCEGRD